MRSAVGRVLGLVLVLLFLMSAVGLAASQTFIDKTGKTVTGIKVEFSKKVMITRHDSVFSDQSPSGRSQEFTFSGGNLRNLGRFSISWMPSSAKVTNYEWIEKAQPAQATQDTSPSSEQEFMLPDPNTPPILYGDDYPGPDEPLYQPKDDEQIWLTDADGHGDIYDNDSIKINYVDGFDKSQITKIEVYRNGIKLRFLPDKLDVLTNAQMKTFDGNPAEHSPASNHTDHAIMGYEYKFKISSADHVWILTKTVKSGFRWRPEEVWAEIGGNWPELMESLSYSDIVDFFHRMKQDGFTGISLDMVYYMTSPYADEIVELRTCDPRIAIWDMRTPTAKELETILKSINEVGMEAHVMGHIYISKEYQNEHGPAGQGYIDPRNPSVFFDSLTETLKRIIPILNRYNVTLLTVFDECDTLEGKHPDLIKAMLTTLSKEFDGELGIDEATHNYLMGESLLSGEPPHQKGFVDIAGRFWDWKDDKGRPLRIEYSCWRLPLDTQKDQRASLMPRNFVAFWQVAADFYAEKYPDNPQMFGEIGSYFADGVCLGDVHSSLEHMGFDKQEMADIWYAYLKGSMALGIDKMNVWIFVLGDLWFSDSTANGTLNIGLKQPESEGYRVITAIIKPDE